jgi:ankyrin repeat protein
MDLLVETANANGNAHAVFRALDILPSTLDETYNQYLIRILSQRIIIADNARHILSWIQCSRTPVHVELIRQALALREDESTINQNAMVEEDYIVEVCLGLVVVDLQSKIVHFVHRTAAEYFSKDHSQRQHFPAMHKEVSKSCLLVLMLTKFRAAVAWDEISRMEKEGLAIGSLSMVKQSSFFTKHSLWRYASIFWAYHLQQQFSSNGSLFDEAVAFLSSSARVSISMQYAMLMWPSPNPGRLPAPMHSPTFEDLYKERPPDRLSGLHAISYYGLSSSLAKVLQSQINDKDSNGWTPLWWAAVGSRCDKTVKWLLARGGSADCYDRNGNPFLQWLMGDSKSWLSFNSILRDRARVHYGDSIHWDGTLSFNDIFQILHYRPVWRTSQTVIRNVVSELSSSAINATSINGNTALMRAALYTEWNLVDILLKGGANLDTQNNDLDTALHLSLQSPRTVRKLDFSRLFDDTRMHFGHQVTLGRDASLNPHDLSHTTAVMEGKIIQLIGKKIDSCNVRGETALGLAIENRFFRVARRLVELGADVNLATGNGQSPLHLACQCPTFKYYVVNNIRLTDRSRLHFGDMFSANLGHDLSPDNSGSPAEGERRPLLKNNALPISSGSSVNGQSETTEPFESFVQFLIQNGANIDAENLDGDTPLTFAISNHFVTLIEVLLQNGAAISRVPTFLLHYAARLLGDPNNELLESSQIAGVKAVAKAVAIESLIWQTLPFPQLHDYCRILLDFWLSPPVYIIDGASVEDNAWAQFGSSYNLGVYQQQSTADTTSDSFVDGRRPILALFKAAIKRFHDETLWNNITLRRTFWMFGHEMEQSLSVTLTLIIFSLYDDLLARRDQAIHEASKLPLQGSCRRNM